MVEAATVIVVVRPSRIVIGEEVVVKMSVKPRVIVKGLRKSLKILLTDCWNHAWLASSMRRGYLREVGRTVMGENEVEVVRVAIKKLVESRSVDCLLRPPRLTDDAVELLAEYSTRIARLSLRKADAIDIVRISPRNEETMITRNISDARLVNDILIEIRLAIYRKSFHLWAIIDCRCHRRIVKGLRKIIIIMVAKHVYHIEGLHGKVLGYKLSCLVGIRPTDSRVT